MLRSVEDVWVLEPQEIAGLLTGEREPSADEIAWRVHVREAQRRANPPAHLGSPPSPPPAAVIGVRDALGRIPDGALVTVDPVTATVNLAG